MRELCTIQVIKSLKPIPGKDNILYASFRNIGFRVVVGKNDFKVGDHCIYVESDTLLPKIPELSFLERRCASKKWEGYRIKAMYFGDLFSEGIALPLSMFPAITTFEEGTVVTDIVGAVKYDPESELEDTLVKPKKRKNNAFVNFFLKFKLFRDVFYPEQGKDSFPSFLHKTDETRAQALSYLFNEENKGKFVYVTEKIDGQSATYTWKDGKFYVCSRRIHLKKPDNSSYWTVVKTHHIKDKLKALAKQLGIKDIAIQGEIIGPGIQGNKYQRKFYEFFVYNVFDIKKQEYVSYKDFCYKVDFSKFRMVPVLGTYVLGQWNDIYELEAFSKGNSLLLNSQIREGIVIRTVDSEPAQRGMANMFSFKVINPDFKAKEE